MEQVDGSDKQRLVTVPDRIALVDSRLDSVAYASAHNVLGSIE